MSVIIYDEAPTLINNIEGFAPAPQSRFDLIMPVFSGFHYNVLDSACTFDEHRHTNHQAIYVNTGQYRCTLNGTKLVLEPGQLVVVKPNDVHSDTYIAPVHCIAIDFQLQHPGSPNLCQSLFVETVLPHQQVVSIRPDGVVPLVERIAREAATNDHVTAMITDALMREFFWLMVRAFGEDVVSPSFMRSSIEQSWRIKLQQMLRSHRNVFPSVSEMAQALGISERTLNTRCRDALGASPFQALMNFKLDQAHSMIVQTEMSVQEISNTLGFANPYHFSTAFKRRFDISPLNLRHHAW